MSSSMMLRIKRVPTLVSNFQKEEGEEGSVRGAGCGRNCLRSCCLPGTTLILPKTRSLIVPVPRSSLQRSYILFFCWNRVEAAIVRFQEAQQLQGWRRWSRGCQRAAGGFLGLPPSWGGKILALTVKI